MVWSRQQAPQRFCDGEVATSYHKKSKIKKIMFNEWMNEWMGIFLFFFLRSTFNHRGKLMQYFSILFRLNFLTKKKNSIIYLLSTYYILWYYSITLDIIIVKPVVTQWSMCSHHNQFHSRKLRHGQISILNELTHPLCTACFWTQAPWLQYHHEHVLNRGLNVGLRSCS